VDKNELQLLEKLAPAHPDLQALWDEHILYEKQLEKLEGKTFRTPQEDQQVKELKKQKLDGKTRMVTLLNQYAAQEG
jgi:uncharacterized protein YdcH (DUF465 family)